MSDKQTTHRDWQGRLAEFGNRIPAPAILICALVTIQFSSGTAKTIMVEENAMGLALFRVVVGSALLWMIVRPPVRSLRRDSWTDVVLLGAAYALFNITAYAALVHLPLAIAVTIGFLGPLAISLLGSRSPVDFLWPLLGFAGVYLLSPSNPGAVLSWTGVAYGLVYAFAWAMYILASARAGRSLRGLDGFVLAGPVAIVFLVPFGFSSVMQFVDGTEILAMAMVVTVSVTIAFGLEFIALKRMEPRVFGVLLSLEPAIASIVGMILLREFLSINGWIAVAVITVAASGVALVKSGHKADGHDRSGQP